jgi:hypothetical protein
MNMASIFSDKRLLDLVVQLSETEPGARESRLAAAGIPLEQRAELLKRAQDFETLRGRLRTMRHDDGITCLDENTLAEFVDGVLPVHQATEAERHLAVCGACLHDAVELAHLCSEIAPEARWPEVVIGMAQRGLRLLSQPFQGFTEHALQPVPVMGPEGDAPAAKSWSATDGGVTAHYTMVMQDERTVSLAVRFSREADALSNARLALRMEECLIEAQPLAESGEHNFWQLTPGRDTVELESGDALAARFSIVIEDIEGA